MSFDCLAQEKRAYCYTYIAHLHEVDLSANSDLAYEAIEREAEK